MAKSVTVTLPKLHPGQIRRRQEIAAAGARFVVTMCGRRWGKSRDASEWLADGVISGQSCALAAPTYKYLLELWRDLSAWLRPLADATGGTVSEQEKHIRLPNGGSLDCWSLDTPNPGLGRRYHRFAVDEAGIVRDLNDIFVTAIRPTLVDFRGACWFYGTPRGRRHDFVQLFARGEARQKGWLAFRAPTRDNPYIPEDELEEAKRDMPLAAYLQEFEGIPADDGANPFGISAIQQCVGPMSDAPPVVWGWDFARAQDWTVGIALDANGHVCRFHRWQNKPWGWTTEEVARLTGHTRAFGDSTGLGDVIVEQIQRLGVPLVGVHFGRTEKQQLMERLASNIQRRRIQFPEGPIRQELESFEYEYTPAGGVRYEAPSGLHDDCVMALALAVKGLGEPLIVRAREERGRHEDIQGPIDWKRMRPVDEPKTPNDLVPDRSGVFRWNIRLPSYVRRLLNQHSTIDGI